jgi:hypothetical protein
LHKKLLTNPAQSNVTDLNSPVSYSKAGAATGLAAVCLPSQLLESLGLSCLGGHPQIVRLLPAPMAKAVTMPQPSMALPLIAKALHWMIQSCLYHQQAISRLTAT